MRPIVGALIWLIALAVGAASQDYLQAVPTLQERLTPDVLAQIFEGVTRTEPADDGGPAALAAYMQAGDEDEGELVGYIFSTLDVLRAPGYTSTPFDIIAGVTLGGRITGAAVLFHREPYLLNDERRTGQLVQFLDVMSGVEARLGASGGLQPEYVAGATISARAMRNAVLESAKIVLRYRNETAPVTEPTIDMLNFRPKSAGELIADGGLANAVVTNADLQAAMDAAGLGDLEPQVLPRGGPDSVYLDLRAGYANPTTVGRNSVGQGAYDRLYEPMREGRHVIVLGSHGVYDFRGMQYNNLTHGFRLERITVTQGDTTFAFDKSDLVTTDHAIGRVASALMLPEDAHFDAMAPWHVDVYAQARHPDGRLEPFHLTRLEYDLPARYVLMPETQTMAAWMEPWVDQRAQIVTLGSALGVLTLILGFQGQLTRRRTLHRWVRMGFLGFTLVWVGWMAGAQLSIVHVINYLQAPFQNLGPAFYLAEPLIVLISIYTAVSLILLGRGVFCGWLCPFGALQELLAHVGRFFRVPQWNPTEAVQRRLWWGKYASLGLIVGLAFVAPAAGSVAAEIEPFKTAITAMFLRGWPYVVYATILLFIGLFTERAFCRFLCPLGGALAVLDRLHMVELLKRRPECGSPCHLCERSCPVKAIETSGKIKMAECFQCLDCMVEYHDDRRCPPLAKLRKQHERAQGIRVPAPRPARANPVPRPIAARVQPAE